MDVTEYLIAFRAEHTLADVLQWLDRIAKLRPLVVGEAILDDYLFCDTLGKANKDPNLVVLFKSVETYAGGALAIANHLAGLCAEVQLITQLGEIDRREDFIRGALRMNVFPYFLTKNDAPTISKQRIVDRYSGNKLFEIYRMNDTPIDNPYQYQLKSVLAEALDNSHLAVVSDFGHGFLSDRIIRQLWASGKFLCVNTQTNAGNRGFNPISKYRRADYICLANHEADLECRQRDGDDCEKLIEITKRVACPHWTITRGKYGTLHYDVLDERFYEAPALATKVIDRVGAGDSVFAVTSLLAKVGCPWPILGFLGNVTGAVQVEALGNKRAIDRAALEARITELLKG